MTVSTAPASGRLGAIPRPIAAPSIAVCIVAAAFAIAASRSTNTDVSWLLTLGERWLGGEVPYVDFIEVNPPASIMAYLPAIGLARSLGCSAEAATVALVVAGSLASLALCGVVLSRAGLLARSSGAWLGCAALVLLLLVPTGDFAEREHLALLAGLPWLSVLLARAEGRIPPAWLAVLAGVGGGLAISIKPQFALGFVGPIAFVLWRQGWRSLLQAWDLFAAGAVATGYGVAVLVLFPAFVADTLPMLLLAYVPIRYPLATMLLSPATLVWLGFALLAVVLWPRTRARSAVTVLLLASFGFQAVFLLQGKNWAYQALPGTLLAALAVCAALAEPRPRVQRGLLAGALAILVALGLLAAWIFDYHPRMSTSVPGLAAAIERAAPHPRLMAITSDIATGHPLIREIGGRWVGTLCANWPTENITKRLASEPNLPEPDRAALRALSEREHAIVLDDIRDKTPDVILLQDGPWTAYVDDSPALTRAFADYRADGHYGNLQLWVRKAS